MLTTYPFKRGEIWVQHVKNSCRNVILISCDNTKDSVIARGILLCSDHHSAFNRDIYGKSVEWCIEGNKRKGIKWVKLR